MRLIDADALEKAIYKWMPKYEGTWMDGWISPIENLMILIMMTIQKQPTVDAEPVRHSKWVIKSNFDEKVNRNYQHILCSECRTCVAYDWEGKLRTALNYKYCPTCGAKMDGERKDNETN